MKEYSNIRKEKMKNEYNNRPKRCLKYKWIQIYANKFENLKKMNNFQDINYVNWLQKVEKLNRSMKMRHFKTAKNYLKICLC